MGVLSLLLSLRLGLGERRRVLEADGEWMKTYVKVKRQWMYQEIDLCPQVFRYHKILD